MMPLRPLSQDHESTEGPRWGAFGGVAPAGMAFGDSGGPTVERYYIEQFLWEHAADIRGSMVWCGNEENETNARLLKSSTAWLDSLPANVYDSIICPQCLSQIYDLAAAVKTLHSGLRVGGVLLATLPGIQRIDTQCDGSPPDYWRFTTQSARRLFEEVFRPTSLRIEACGNVLAALASLHGIATGELESNELEDRDPDYEVIITVRAVKRDDA